MDQVLGKFYGKYKKTRNAAWRVHLEYQIHRLPINVMELIKKMGIAIFSYSNGLKLLKELELENFCTNNEGFSLFLNGRWIIFYNENIVPRSRIRFTLAHELGHILLGHKMKIIKSSVGEILYTEENIDNNLNKKKKQQIEIDADMFAIRLLAPAIVLYSLEITNPYDIMYLCGLPFSIAKERSARLKKLSTKGKFLSSSLEKDVFNSFRDFISNYPYNSY